MAQFVGSGNGDEGDTTGRNGPTKTPVDIDILEEWADVIYQPLPLEQVAVIEYPERFRRIFGLLNAATKLKERSMRGIRLAKSAIELNKAHVTAWTYRYECALSLSTIWKEELASIGNLLLKSPKNYQAWNYRRHCVTHVGTCKDEASFIDVTLANDAKNYHAWAHRQWVLKKNGLDTEDELIMMDILISEDVRNNSAWNHRWLIIASSGTEMKERQVKYALGLVDKAPRNEAVWNFIAAVISSDKDIAMEAVDGAIAVAKKCLEGDSENIPARKFLACTGHRNNPQEALEECVQLAKIDKVRRKYWEHRADQWRTAIKKDEKEK